MYIFDILRLSVCIMSGIGCGACLVRGYDVFVATPRRTRTLAVTRMHAAKFAAIVTGGVFIVTSASSIVLQFQPACDISIRLTACWYVLSNWVVYIFLFLKQRIVRLCDPVTTGEKLILSVTLMVPVFAVVCGVFVTGDLIVVDNAPLRTICSMNVPWVLSMVMAGLNTTLASLYIVLFVQPLWHVSDPDMRQALCRNITACTISIVSTFATMCSLVVLAYCEDAFPGAQSWGPTIGTVDVLVDMCAVHVCTSKANNRASYVVANTSPQLATRQATLKINQTFVYVVSM